MKKVFRTVFVALIAMALLGGYGVSDSSSPMVGEWAWAHAPETAVLRVEENGSALYEGVNYTWEDEETALWLTGENGESFSLRYLIAEEQALLYPVAVYEKTGEVDQSGLIGIWTEPEGRGGSFVFTPSGSFLEDSMFSGSYTVDEENGTFLLSYGGLFADTLCYFTIGEDGLLRVEYPWPIVRLSQAS